MSKSNQHDWVLWDGYTGAKPPVDSNTLVQVKFVGGGSCRTLLAGELYWWIDRSLPTAIKCYKVYEG